MGFIKPSAVKRWDWSNLLHEQVQLVRPSAGVGGIDQTLCGICQNFCGIGGQD